MAILGYMATVKWNNPSSKCFMLEEWNFLEFETQLVSNDTVDGSEIRLTTSDV